MVYAVFALVAKVLDPGWILPRVTNIGVIMLVLQSNALMVVAVAFVCSLIWFIAGEWAIQAWAPVRTWYLTWVLLFIVVVAAAIYYAFQGPVMGSLERVNSNVLGCYLAVGLLPFYLSSLLFTSTNRRYVIWPSRHVVKW